MCSRSGAPAALPPALLQSPESSPFPQLTVPTAGTAPLAACCLSHSPFSSCCQEPPSSSFGFLCSWMALGGVHCRGVLARLKAGRGGVQSQVARAPRWRGSNLEHPGSRPSLPSSWPPSHSPSARGQAGVTALQQPLQPLPACLAARSLVQTTVRSRSSDFSSHTTSFAQPPFSSRLASPFLLNNLSSLSWRPPQQPALPASQNSGSLQLSHTFCSRQSQVPGLCLSPLNLITSFLTLPPHSYFCPSLSMCITPSPPLAMGT